VSALSTGHLAQVQVPAFFFAHRTLEPATADAGHWLIPGQLHQSFADRNPGRVSERVVAYGSAPHLDLCPFGQRAGSLQLPDIGAWIFFDQAIGLEAWKLVAVV